MVNMNHILFSAYAKLPSGTASSEMYGVMALVVVIDIQTGVIIEAECTLSTRMAERFVQRLMIGRNLEKELETMIAELNTCYQGSAQKAITTALRIVVDKYTAYKKLQATGR